MKEKIEQIKTNSIMEIEKAETQKELADASGEPEHQPNCKTRQCDGDGLQAGYRGH